jgi:large subunit ribosomal protein L10
LRGGLAFFRVDLNGLYPAETREAVRFSFGVPLAPRRFGQASPLNGGTPNGGENKVLRSEKEAIIKELNTKFSRAKSAIVAEFNKIDVATVTSLRKKFRDSKVEYKVLKNTLAKRAAKGTSVEAISEDFYGSVAVALGYEDVVAPAKIIVDFTKDKDVLKVRSAVIEGHKTDAKGVVALARLPGLPELRAKILGLLMQPASKLVRTIAAPGNQLARVLKARGETLAKQS